MKRGTPRHPKMRRLAKALDLPLSSAVGIMELLWHFTAEFALEGDVGRHTDQDIADAVGWEGDAEALVTALVDSGWVDRSDTHRLMIHDWLDHCEDWVKKRIKRMEDDKKSASKAPEKGSAANGSQRQPTAADGSLPCLAPPCPSPAMAQPCPAPAEPDAAATGERAESAAPGESGERAGELVRLLEGIGYSQTQAMSLAATYTPNRIRFVVGETRAKARDSPTGYADSYFEKSRPHEITPAGKAAHRLRELQTNRGGKSKAKAAI